VTGKIDWGPLEKSETSAYTNESYIFQATGYRSLDQVWNPRWAPNDAESARSKGVSAAVKESVDEVKRQVREFREIR
jgi:hypothetical protein